MKFADLYYRGLVLIVDLALGALVVFTIQSLVSGVLEQFASVLR